MHSFSIQNFRRMSKTYFSSTTFLSKNAGKFKDLGKSLSHLSVQGECRKASEYARISQFVSCVREELTWSRTLYVAGLLVPDR